QTRASVLEGGRRIRLRKWGEESAHGFRIDADPGIADPEHYGEASGWASAQTRLQANTPLLCKLYCVDQQVHEDLPNSHWIALDHPRHVASHRGFEHQALGKRTCGEHFDDTL